MLGWKKILCKETQVVSLDESSAEKTTKNIHGLSNWTLFLEGKRKKCWIVVMKSDRLTGMASVEGPLQCANILEAFFCCWLQQ